MAREFAKNKFHRERLECNEEPTAVLMLARELNYMYGKT